MTHNNIEFISVESALQLYQGRHIDNDLLLIDEVADLPLPNESRRMKSLLLALCIRGEAQYTVDTIEYKVKPNDIILISNGQVVDDYLLSRDCSGIAIMVSYDFYREIVSDVHELSSLFIFSRNHPVVTLSEDEARMIQEYYQLLKNKVEDQNHHFRREVARSLLSTVIYDLSNSLYHIANTTTIKQTRADRIFKEFIQLVEANYREKRRVTWYGNQLCISPKYLSETVKSVSHQTPNDWIDRYVILEICNLLRNTTKSIKEITQDMHFPTQSFLGRYFKEHVGVSPKEYRRG